MLLQAMTQYDQQITRQGRRAFARRDHLAGVFHRRLRAHRARCVCGDTLPTYLQVCRRCAAEALARDLARAEASHA